jgi:fatty-acyl-CoA synthase
LSATVWHKFRERFRIPHILEFYAATEGTFSLYNCEGKPGAIGRIPRFLAHRFPMALLKFDHDRGLPQRNEDGFCLRCSADEVGEAIGWVSDDESGAARPFEGYSDGPASEAKLLRSAFVSGDVWFRTGDLMRRDKQGYLYFVDRVGDTYRWKGENVSTTHVAEIICEYPGVTQALVYGVVIPNTEGRAGMATIALKGELDTTAFRKYLGEHLPEYARPLFIRLANCVQLTPTFKVQKHVFAQESYDPSATTDPILFNDPVRQEFLKLDLELYKLILAGQVRI